MTLKEIWLGLQDDWDRMDEWLLNPVFWIMGLPFIFIFLVLLLGGIWELFRWLLGLL